MSEKIERLYYAPSEVASRLRISRKQLLRIVDKYDGLVLFKTTKTGRRLYHKDSIKILRESIDSLLSESEMNRRNRKFKSFRINDSYMDNAKKIATLVLYYYTGKGKDKVLTEKAIKAEFQKVITITQ